MCSVEVILRPIAVATLESIPEALHRQRGLSDSFLSVSLPAVMLAAAFPARFDEFQKNQAVRKIQSRFVPVCFMFLGRLYLQVSFYLDTRLAYFAGSRRCHQ